MLAVPWQADTDGHLRPVELAGFVEPSRAATYARYLWSAVRRFVPGGRR
jgi:hypothetical protein